MSETNGTAKRRRKAGEERDTALPLRVRFAALEGAARSVGKAKPRVTRGAVPVAGSLRRWAYTGVGLCLALSAGLNGMAFAEHAPAVWAGWGLGCAVPALVLILSRVAAQAWERGWRRLAWGGAVAVLAMLALSVQHMATSIARLTGEHVGLAALMAVAIDAGLVVCELATVRGK